MSEIYICPDHRAEWDVFEQHYVCHQCTHRWSEFDVPQLLAQIAEIQKERDGLLRELTVSEDDRYAAKEQLNTRNAELREFRLQCKEDGETIKELKDVLKRTFVGVEIVSKEADGA